MGPSAQINPFDPNRCSQGPDYYLSFPPPWNVLPQAQATPVSELLKLAPHALPKFNGDRKAYLSWRSAFIPCVHLTTANLSFKVMLLRSTMLPEGARMKEFIRSIICTPEGYREAVRQLESRYGGDENRLLSRQEELLSLPILKEGDFRTLEALETRLQTYLMEWRSYNAGDAESLTLFTTLMSRIDRRFGRRYVYWAEERRRDRGLGSLQAWLREQLEVHRTVEQYYSHTDQTNTDKEAAKPNTKWLPSCNDKNYKREAQFFAEGAALDWAEEVEQEQGVAQTFVAQQQQQQQPQAGNAPFNNKPFCPICRAPHKLGHCYKFKAMTPAERKTVLAKDRRCFLCFQKGHLVTKCRLGIKCSTCGKKHNSMLHGADQPKETTLTTTTSEQLDLEGATDTVLLAGDVHARVSLRTTTVWVQNPQNNQKRLVNVLLDDCSKQTGQASREERDILDVLI